MKQNSAIFLKMFYYEYLARILNNISKENAVSFGSPAELHDHLLTTFSEDQISAVLAYLSEKGFIEMHNDATFELNDNTIGYMGDY